MARIVEFGIGCFFVLLFVGGGLLAAAAGMLRSPFGVLTLIGATGIVLVLVVIVFGVLAALAYRWWQRSAEALQYVAPDQAGRMPIPKVALNTPEGVAMAYQQNSASFFQNVSTYSPRSDGGRVDLSPGPVDAIPMLAPPPFLRLYQDNQLPRSGYLLGYSVDTGEAITADTKKLFSTLMGGGSGSGKSTLARVLLAQAAMQGAKFVVIDPHAGAGEDSLGDSLTPLAPLMLRPVATEDKDIIAALDYVLAVGRDRLSGRDRERWPLMLIVDETTAILQRGATSQHLLQVLAMITQETRKVGVVAICLGQNFNGRVMDTTVRDSFASYMSTKQRANVAATMTGDQEFGKTAGQLAIGQAIWWSAKGDRHIINVPNCTKDDLTAIVEGDYKVISSSTGDFQATSKALPSHFQGTSNGQSLGDLEVGGSGSGSGSEVGREVGTSSIDASWKASEVRRLIIMGATQHEIIETVWQTKGGRKYQEGVEEYRKILTQLMR